MIQAKEEKDKLAEKNKELDSQVGLLKEQIKSLEQSQQALKNEKAELKAEKDNLTTDLSNAKNQVIQAKEEKDKLEQKCVPYEKLERLYEVFLEVKGCLGFGFVEKTHSAMDLIASVLSDSKYYLESLYNKASQELSDKGEKLAELFDLLFEYVKDNKFERLKEPSAYNSTCKKLYPEQNTSQKIQRVVLIGYTYDKKQPITLSWIWDHKMGTFIKKCFSFYQVRQVREVREELEARISELEDENENLTDENTRLLASKEWPTKENAELLREKEQLTKENENLAVKISELENSNDQLWQAKDNLTKEKTELTEKNKALTTEKDNLAKANTELKKENDKLNHQIIALTKEQDSLKQERA